MLFYADTAHSLKVGETATRLSERLELLARSYDGVAVGIRSVALDTHPALVGVAITLGELHQGLADLLNPGVDDTHSITDALGAAATLLGRCLYRSASVLQAPAGDDAALTVIPRHAGRAGLPLLAPADDPSMSMLLRDAASAVRTAADATGIDEVESNVPEGYAFYSLYPEMYLASLGRYLLDEGPRPGFVVIGVRSIGCSLAGLVAGALVERGFDAKMETVRPRGHPFRRYVALASGLAERLGKRVEAGQGILVVDEGPGLTCSSLLSVCSALEGLGADEKRIGILAAWAGRPSIFASEEARGRWGSLRVYHTSTEEAFDGWQGLIPFVLSGSECREAAGGAKLEDLSYGRWRERMYPSSAQWPVVHRATERTKLLISTPTTELLAKFAGLGEYGDEKLARATALAEAGFAPRALGLAYGFLIQPFLPSARPLAREDLCRPLLIRLVDYYAFIASRFAHPPTPKFDALARLISLNYQEALGRDATDFLAAWQWCQTTVDSLPLALIDGKPEPHEWLRLDGHGGPCYLKTDSADHFQDHTLVGEQSILWDLAGACEEWRMDRAATAQFLRLWEERTDDRLAATLLDFYRAAYLAFRLAALHYAIHSTDEEDIRLSMQQEQWGYRQRLAELVEGHRDGRCNLTSATPPGSAGDSPPWGGASVPPSNAGY